MNIYEDANDNQDETTHLTHDQYMEHKQACESIVEQAKQAAKLSEYPEFKSIVMEAYFDEEPKRLAGLMACGRLSEKQFDECATELKAIGSMRSFLQDYITKGQIAETELQGLKQAWEDAVSDQVDDGSA